MTLLLDYATSGINFSLPGNGGPECLNYISFYRRVVEDIIAIGLSSSALFLGLKNHSKPSNIPTKEPHSGARIAFLVAMTFAYALELAYKLATKQLIFILNPCHMLCVIQIYLLAMRPNSSLITYVFRIHLFFLHGPINAVIFPVTNTLLLPGEVFTYWLEHAFLLTIPIYLLRFGGNQFTVGSTLDISWSLMSYGFWGLYHFIFLEGLAVTLLANMNSMLCPAISDPFYGPSWRAWAICHQFILNLASGTLFGLFGISESDTSKNKITKEKL